MPGKYPSLVQPIFVILLADVLIIAPLTAWIANERGRSPSIWFVLAAVAGPVALVALALAPARWEVEEARRRVRRCPECDTRVSLEATRCPACRAKLPLPPAPEPEPAPAPAPEPEPEREPEPKPEREPEPALPLELPPSIIVTQVRRRGTPSVSAAPLTEEAERLETVGRGAQSLASGVFAGGATEMIVGYRYLISVTARQLQISGPVDVAPQRIVFRAPRGSVEAASLNNDIVIGAEPSRGRRVQLVFRGVSGGQGDHLVAVLDRSERPAQQRTRRRTNTPSD